MYRLLLAHASDIAEAVANSVVGDAVSSVGKTFLVVLIDLCRSRKGRKVVKPMMKNRRTQLMSVVNQRN